MGTFSYYIEDNVKVLDLEGLKGVRDSSNFYNVIGELGDLDFNKWDSLKIESYWYSQFVKYLYSIAPFIKGFVLMEFEEGYKFKIIFQNGEVYFNRQVQAWTGQPSLIKLNENDEVRF